LVALENVEPMQQNDAGEANSCSNGQEIFPPLLLSESSCLISLHTATDLYLEVHESNTYNPTLFS
jgi:hypothetical protein